MDKYATTSTPAKPKKIYVTLVGSAPMASFDALMLSLDRFKGILSSDSAKERFETTLRTIKTTLSEVDQFIDQVYSEKNPKLSVAATNRTLVIEIDLTKEQFLGYIDDGKINQILTQIKVIGTMPAKKTPLQAKREYTSFRVSYENGKFRS